MACSPETHRRMGLSTRSKSKIYDWTVPVPGTELPHQWPIPHVWAASCFSVKDSLYRPGYDWWSPLSILAKCSRTFHLTGFSMGPCISQEHSEWNKYWSLAWYIKYPSCPKSSVLNFQSSSVAKLSPCGIISLVLSTSVISSPPAPSFLKKTRGRMNIRSLIFQRSGSLLPASHYKWGSRRDKDICLPTKICFPHISAKSHRWTQEVPWGSERKICCNWGLHGVEILAWWSVASLSKEVGSAGIPWSCHQVTYGAT